MINKQKGRQRKAWGSKDANHGVNRLHMLSKDDYSAISKKKIHRDAHGPKKMHLELSQQLVNCDDVRGFFY